MKKSVAEIIGFRTKEKCYLIENKEGDFFVIHGSFLGKVLFGELFDSIICFKRNEVDWKYIERRIRWDRDEDDPKREKRNWSYIQDVKSEIIDIENLTIDGKVQEIE